MNAPLNTFPTPDIKQIDLPVCRRQDSLRSLIDHATHFEERCWLTGSPHGRSWNNSLTKRYLDATVALVFLIIASPLMLAIALAIKCTSRGPVLFRQQRTGYRGRQFQMYKFRTMVVNAEALKAQIAHLNQHSNSPDFKAKNDPRITRVGRFLRQYSLDELPQFLNVVLGDMRLVGPRPTSFGAHTYEPHHLSRLASPPGLTGIWQISGRANINFDRRVELDVKYIKRQSPCLDLFILIRTPLAIFKGDGAC
jgi:lipopolysaccharide/colanic/teichoic acid biosynthesis glycosyltransferase